MTRFATMFSNAAASNLVRQFGSTIVYQPRHGDARSIQHAIIEREQQILDQQGVVIYAIVIRVEDSVTTGIAATEIDTGGDSVLVPVRIGESPVRKEIVQVLSTENGIVRFVVN